MKKTAQYQFRFQRGQTRRNRSIGRRSSVGRGPETLELRRLLDATGFLQGTAFVDANGAGTLGVNDATLPGATVTLYEQGQNGQYAQVGAPATTDSNGNYFFGNLEPGNYRIVETPPIGYDNSAAQALSQVNPATVVSPNSVDVTLLDPSTLSASVDRNNISSTAQDTVNIKLFGATTTTLPQFPSLGAIPLNTKAYQFPVSINSGPPLHMMSVDLVNYLNPAADTSSFPVLPDSSIPPYGPGSGYVPSNTTPQQENAGSIAYLMNHYGTQTLDQTDAVGLQLAIWKLVCDTGSDLSSFTSGNFQITGPYSGPSGQAQLSAEEAQAEQYISESHGKTELATFLDATQGGTTSSYTPGAPDSGYLQSFVAAGSLNFGNVAVAGIGGVVYHDVDQSGSYNAPPDTPIPGATVTLSGSNFLGESVLQTATTGGDGSYSFTNLAPSGAGGYTLTLTTPANYVDEEANVGTINGTAVGAASAAGTSPLTISSIVLQAGESGLNYNFAEITPPAITSAATTTFVTGVSGTFSVTATGSPTPALTETGALPGGVTFVDNGNGTATLAGTPTAGSTGTFPITIKAANGISPDATQNFVLTVNQAPAITSADSTDFAVGSPNTFTVTTTGSPTAAISETGALPSGVTFVDNGNGTATIAGTPALGTQGSYTLNITASNGVLPNQTQTFTLTAMSAGTETEPAILSPNAATFAFGIPTTFTIATTGSPTPTITETGALPSGLTFVDNGNGTATIAGAPAANSVGTYQLTITAHNGVGNDAVQVFTLTVGNFGYYLAGIPGDGTNQTFVHSLYRELLGREPEADGFAFWNAYLAGHNTINGREQVVSGFLNSPEYRDHYVTVLYEVLLGRAPEASGLQFWTDKMGDPGTPGGHTGSADEKYIMAAIIGSYEFYADAGGTAQGFVTALYKDLLDRAPDSGGLASWVAAVNAQPDNRDGIVRDFMSSPEFIYDLLNTFYPATGGTAGHLLPAPGTAVTAPSPVLAILTGDGWENLYLEGPYGNSSPQGNDAFFTALAAGAPWDDVQLLMLNTDQFYTNPNRPLTLA